MKLWAFPILLQGVVLFFDEWVYHRRRGLPRWERWGHPLDTLTLFLLFLGVFLFPPTPTARNCFIVWSVFSCLFVTKDEWVHQKHCEPVEHWLHALLFLLHPVTCLSLWSIWPSLDDHKGIFVFFMVSVFAFMIYQIVYWHTRVPAKCEKTNYDKQTPS